MKTIRILLFIVLMLDSFLFACLYPAMAGCFLLALIAYHFICKIDEREED